MDTCSWMGGWVDGHHKAPPSRDGQVGYYWDHGKSKGIMDYGDKHQQNTETSSAFVYTQWQKQNLTDTQTTYIEVHDLCPMCVALDF